MTAATILSIDELRRHVGTEIAVSDWLEVTQEHIDEFAEATGDRQWIHVDPERAARESPYGRTVAHGFLTLSMLSRFLSESITVTGMRMGINYGFDRVRFTGPVPSGSRIRAHFTLAKLEDIGSETLQKGPQPPLQSPDHGRNSDNHGVSQSAPRGVQMTWRVTVEREGAERPVLVADWITRRQN